jgi:predicted S18 family serine protease
MGTNGGCGCEKELRRIGVVGLNAIRKIRLLEQRIAEQDAEIEKLKADIVDMVQKAVAKHRPAYDEQQQVIAALREQVLQLKDYERRYRLYVPLQESGQ